MKANRKLISQRIQVVGRKRARLGTALPLWDYAALCNRLR